MCIYISLLSVSRLYDHQAIMKAFCLEHNGFKIEKLLVSPYLKHETDSCS